MKLYSVVLRVGECLIDLESIAHKLWVSCMPDGCMSNHIDHKGILQIIVDINPFSFLESGPPY